MPKSPCLEKSERENLFRHLLLVESWEIASPALLHTNRQCAWNQWTRAVPLSTSFGVLMAGNEQYATVSYISLYWPPQDVLHSSSLIPFIFNYHLRPTPYQDPHTPILFKASTETLSSMERAPQRCPTSLAPFQTYGYCTLYNRAKTRIKKAWKNAETTKYLRLVLPILLCNVLSGLAFFIPHISSVEPRLISFSYVPPPLPPLPTMFYFAYRFVILPHIKFLLEIQHPFPHS